MATTHERLDLQSDSASASLPIMMHRSRRGPLRSRSRAGSHLTSERLEHHLMPWALVLALMVLCPALDAGLAHGASVAETFESVSTSDVEAHFEVVLLAPDADRTGAGVRSETAGGLVFVSIPGGVLDGFAPRVGDPFRGSAEQTRTDAAELSRISRLQQQYLAFAGAIVPSERDFFSSHVQTLPPPIRRLTS